MSTHFHHCMFNTWRFSTCGTREVICRTMPGSSLEYTLVSGKSLPSGCTGRVLETLPSRIVISQWGGSVALLIRTFCLVLILVKPCRSGSSVRRMQ